MDTEPRKTRIPGDVNRRSRDLNAEVCVKSERKYMNEAAKLWSWATSAKMTNFTKYLEKFNPNNLLECGSR